MSTATLPSPAGSSLTAADVARLPRTLATIDVDYELHDGRLVVTVPLGANHARQQAKFARYLLTEGEERGYGQAFAKVGVLLRRNPVHLLGTDTAFLSTTQLPPRLSPEGYLLTVPQLIVEVLCKSDTQHEIDAKVQDYLAAGAVLVWVADPDSRTVTAHRANQPQVVFTAADILSADPVISGFAVPVAELLPE